MPRPQIYPVKRLIGFDQEQLDAIETWRRRQTPIPTVSEAIRRLVQQALAGADRRPIGAAARNKAVELASREIDKMRDQSGTEDQRAHRKRHLVKGPPELRNDRPKSKK
jgi:hypothetical protein